MFKIAVLISGNGSNLEALIDACKKNVINGSIDIVISNNPDAYGIQRAKNHSINYKIIDNNRFESREDFDQALVEELKDSNPDLIVLAGFMRILTSVMIEAFKKNHEGLISLDDSILVKNEFKSIVDGSIFKLSSFDDSDKKSYEKIGSYLTLKELIYDMITISSNFATNLVIDYIGTKEINNTMRSLGANNINVL